MAKTHTLTKTVTYKTGSVSPSWTRTIVNSNELEILVNEVISQSASDQLVAFALDISQLKSIRIKASGGLTIETNNGTTPDDTITIPTGGGTLTWTGLGTGQVTLTKPLWLTADVTALYCTEPGTADVTLEISALVDATV